MSVLPQGAASRPRPPVGVRDVREAALATTGVGYIAAALAAYGFGRMPRAAPEARHSRPHRR